MSPHSTAALIMCASVWGSKGLMKEKAMRERGCKQERLISCWKSSPARAAQEHLREQLLPERLC